MELLFLKICIISSCIGWCYTVKFTANYGFLDWLPQYYPRWSERLLKCGFCISGWLSIIGVLAFISVFKYWTILYLIIVPCCTMVMYGIIEKMTTKQDSTFRYN